MWWVGTSGFLPEGWEIRVGWGMGVGGWGGEGCVTVLPPLGFAPASERSFSPLSLVPHSHSLTTLTPQVNFFGVLGRLKVVVGK